MDDEEDDAEHQHDAADDDVADAQEGILGAQQRRRRDDDALPAGERLHRIRCGYTHTHTKDDPMRRPLIQSRRR